jgi:hypothetical protein
MPVVYRGSLGQKLTIAQLDGNFQTLVTNITAATASISTLQTNLAGVTASLAVGLPGTNNFQFIFLSAGVTYSATFSFVGGILATHSTPFAI